jgi:putative Mg2+ transporter-C (MgtC) family protein
MNIIYLDLIKIGLSLLCGLLLGYDREQTDKPCGLRTVSLICFGATLITIMTFKLVKYELNFDAIRAIAYYLVAIGFVGGGIINQQKGKITGITTASLLLPISIIGFLIGLEEFLLAGVATLGIYLILKLKYIRIKFETKRRKRYVKRKRK